MYRTALTFLVLAAVAPCLGAEVEEKNIPGWGIAKDPDGNCKFTVNEKTLTIRAPGPVHDLSAELGQMNAPRVLQKVKGDFVAKVKVLGEFSPGEATVPQRTAYNGAGLLLMASDQTYVRLDRATLVRSGVSQHYANFELRKDGKIERFGTPIDYEIDPKKDTYLRIERKGDKVLGAVAQEPGKWHDLQPKTVDLAAELRVGVAAVNCSSRPFAPKFEDFSVVAVESERKADH